MKTVVSKIPLSPSSRHTDRFRGTYDKDGFLFVLGREKSLLIGHDGEKYSPEGIEEIIVAHSPFIDQIMLYNNQSPYTTALIVPNKENLLSDDWAIRNNGFIS